MYLFIYLFISDPRRGRYMVLHTFIFSFFFFSFSRHDFIQTLSLEPSLQIECAAWSCGLILHYWLPSNSFH